jgi:hypothetical protein
MLTLAHQRQRLAWARAHSAWTNLDWDYVLFSDEAKVPRVGNVCSQWVWRENGMSDYSPRTVIGTLKFGGGSIMIWGCMTSRGVGWMCRLDGGMDSEIYVGILKDELQHSMNYFFEDTADATFQHDNDPKHTSKKAKQFLSKQRYKTMSWPSQSPDLNPIEQLWTDVKRRLKLLEPFASLDVLWTTLQQVWESTDQDLCKRLVHSMPDRVAAVIRAKGGNTRY